jgi:hypothetical protein
MAPILLSCEVVSIPAFSLSARMSSSMFGPAAGTCKLFVTVGVVGVLWWKWTGSEGPTSHPQSHFTRLPILLAILLALFIVFLSYLLISGELCFVAG